MKWWKYESRGLEESTRMERMKERGEGEEKRKGKRRGGREEEGKEERGKRRGREGGGW